MWLLFHENLTWPEIAAYYESSSPPTNFSFRNQDGSFTDYETWSDLLYVAEDGSQVRINRNDWGKVLKSKGRTLWTGEIRDISTDRNLVAVSYWSESKDGTNIESSVIDCESGVVKKYPRSIVSLFRGGMVIAQEDPATSITSIRLVRGTVVQRSFTIEHQSLKELSGLSSNGTSTVVTTYDILTFFGPNKTWSAGSGLLHAYRNAKIVNDFSCLSTCWSTSPLMGWDFHLELRSEHNLALSSQVNCNLLIVGDDVKRLRPLVNNAKKPQ